ncbi:MAG: transporter [Pseudomonadota bacterium]
MNTEGLLYTLVPLAALAIGAITTTMAKPKPGVQSAIQHFAAGVVFAAAAAEILPDVMHGGSLVPIIIGSLAGIGAMLAIKALDERIEGPVGLATATGVDLLVDGLVLGISFVAGARQGILLTIALTLEVLFLGLSLVGEFAQSMTRGKAIGATMLVGLALPFGALFGGPIGTLPGPLQTGFYAFGLIALLYLVTEELLIEAHEGGKESPLVTSMFFLGFLAILVVDELMR